MSKEPIWNEFLTERDKKMWAVSGYGARAGYGKRPALLVIDVNYNFTGDRSEPILGRSSGGATPAARRGGQQSP